MRPNNSPERETRPIRDTVRCALAALGIGRAMSEPLDSGAPQPKPRRRAGYTVDTEEWSFPVNDPIPLADMLEAFKGMEKYEAGTIASLCRTKVPGSRANADEGWTVDDVDAIARDHK